MRLARLVIVAAVALVSFEASAFAAPSDPKIEDVKFIDADKLTTSSLSADGMLVNGTPRPVRIILTRPRLTFVPELLTSIQNL
jgi:hypothetical protein